MLRFAANLTMMYNEVPFLERFAAAAADGFDAVEYLFPYDFAPDDIAKRLGPHGENALADVDRKTLRLRLAKLWFRLRHGLCGGACRPLRVLFTLQTQAGPKTRRRLWPKLH